MPALPKSVDHRNARNLVAHKIVPALTAVILVLFAAFWLASDVAGAAILPSLPLDGKYQDVIKAIYALLLFGCAGYLAMRLLQQFGRLSSEEKKCLTEIEADLRNGQFGLYFQPVFDLRQDRIVAARAVPFWRLGLAPQGQSAEIIALVKRSFMLHQIVVAVLTNAARLVAELEAAGICMDVSVNISGTDVETLDLVGKIDRICETAAISPHRLRLEVPEEEAGRLLANQDLVDQLRQRAIKLVLGDFGAATGALHAVEDGTFALIEVDRGVISRMLMDRGAAATLKACREMSAMLGIDLIADGVEDSVTAARLADLGINLVQGPLFGRPMLIDDFVYAVKRQPRGRYGHQASYQAARPAFIEATPVEDLVAVSSAS
ncbi:MAG TPA: EAL domain-containing protein [Terriglobales bacterium]|nr:EAL domain-containing protein [Terriglobales bacterium]